MNNMDHTINIIILITVVSALFSCHNIVHSLSIPLIRTQGTHYEVGWDIGKTFQSQIYKYISRDPHLLPIFYPWSKTKEGQTVVNGLYEVARKEFPLYAEELQGMADGSNISFDKLLLMNLRSELSAILLKDRKSYDSCSDILVNRPRDNCAAIGHNEDNGPLIKECGYFVVAKIYPNKTETSDNRGIAEEFTAYSYPGELSGNAFGFNKHGLSLSINGLYPQNVQLNKLARNFLTRAILASKRVEDIEDILLKSAGTAYAFSANVGIHANSPRMFNIEVAPSKVKPSNIDVKEIKPRQDNSSNGNYFHVNMYRRINITQIAKDVVSSKHRTRRIKDMGLPTDLPAIKNILGDDKDILYPIYRSPRPTDSEATAATGIFDLIRRKLTVYKDNPKNTSGALYEFDIPKYVSNSNG